MQDLLGLAFDFMFAEGFAALLGAFLWGVFSVLLSPCGAAMLPLVVGYVENTDEPGFGAAFRASLAFCVGVIVNLVFVGALAASVGKLFSGHEVWLTVLVGALFVVMGFHLAGLIKIPWNWGGRFDVGTYRGARGALVLGTVSGLALGPCSFAYATPILSLAAQFVSDDKVLTAALITLSYALGYSAVLVAAGVGAKSVTRWLERRNGGAALRILNFICGAGLIAGGAYFILNALPGIRMVLK